MISSCANPECSAQYRIRDKGKIFVEEQAFGMEFFWLCSHCASRFDLSFDPQGPRLEPLYETRRMFCQPNRTPMRLAS
jgi:hypothetical protein